MWLSPWASPVLALAHAHGSSAAMCISSETTISLWPYGPKGHSHTAACAKGVMGVMGGLYGAYRPPGSAHDSKPTQVYATQHIPGAGPN